jgi:hypothetical protein
MARGEIPGCLLAELRQKVTELMTGYWNDNRAVLLAGGLTVDR